MTDIIASTWPIWAWVLSGLIAIEIVIQGTSRFFPEEFAGLGRQARCYLGDTWRRSFYVVAAVLGPVMFLLMLASAAADAIRIMRK